MTDLEKAKSLLLENNKATCAIVKGDKIYISGLRGVKPLVQWYESSEDFDGFFAADKVVGKGAAFLYALLGVKEIYAGVISESALEVLKSYGIKAEYSTLVNNIINRKGDGICPFEEAVLNVDDKDKAYVKIKAKMQELNIPL